MESFGKALIGLGIMLVLVGLVAWGAADKPGWLGRLPGDMRIVRPGLQVYLPFTSMILLSIGISFGLWLYGKFFR